MSLSDLVLFALCIFTVSFAAYFLKTLPKESSFDPNLWAARLRPLHFRAYRSTDLESCLELYRLNEPGRFPPGMLKHYWDVLANERAYFLVAEQDGQIVASGGMNHYDQNNTVFCFGLVHPHFHGCGIGTTLLYARLALLDLKPGYPHAVVISTIERSVRFYERFGFKKKNIWIDSTGASHPSAYLTITHDEIAGIRKLLQQQKIDLPLADIPRIPTLAVQARTVSLPNNPEAPPS